jgi:hypothetical protein
MELLVVDNEEIPNVIVPVVSLPIDNLPKSVVLAIMIW